MFLLLKKADAQEEWDEQEKQEKEYFGTGIDAGLHTDLNPYLRSSKKLYRNKEEYARNK